MSGLSRSVTKPPSRPKSRPARAAAAAIKPATRSASGMSPGMSPGMPTAGTGQPEAHRQIRQQQSRRAQDRRNQDRRTQDRLTRTGKPSVASKPARPPRDYSIAAVARTLDLLEALASVGRRRSPPLPTRRVHPHRGLPAAAHLAVARLRHPGRGPRDVAPGARWARWDRPPKPGRAGGDGDADHGRTGQARVRTSICTCATAGRRDHRNLQTDPGCAFIPRSANVARCTPAPAGCCWPMRPKRYRPRCWRSETAALHAGDQNRCRLDRRRSATYPHPRLPDHRR